MNARIKKIMKYKHAIPWTAAMITALVTYVLPIKPHTVEELATGFGAAGAFAGAALGIDSRLPQYREWLHKRLLPLPLLGLLLFLSCAVVYLLMWRYIYNPEWWQITIELVLYSIAACCLVFLIVLSGAKLWTSQDGQQDSQ